MYDDRIRCVAFTARGAGQAGAAENRTGRIDLRKIGRLRLPLTVHRRWNLRLAPVVVFGQIADGDMNRCAPENLLGDGAARDAQLIERDAHTLQKVSPDDVLHVDDHVLATGYTRIAGRRRSQLHAADAQDGVILYPNELRSRNCRAKLDGTGVAAVAGNPHGSVVVEVHGRIKIQTISEIQRTETAHGARIENALRSAWHRLAAHAVVGPVR